MTPQRFASGRFGGVARLPGHQVGRVISNLFGGGSAQELLDSAPFCSELLYTAIPQRAASGTTGTFTRATTETWTNNDGYMVTGVAGEIGFVGARRVRNHVQTTSEDLSNAAWFALGATSPTATTVLATAGVGIHARRNSGGTAVAGSTWILQAKVSAGTYTHACIGEDGDAAYHSATFNLTTGVVSNNNNATGTIEDLGGGQYLCSVKLTRTNAGSVRPCVGMAAAGGTINAGFVAAGTETIIAEEIQLEDVTAQTTQTAGEYVSVGVVQRNKILNSNNVSLWGVVSNTTLTANQLANPINGVIDAWKVAATASAASNLNTPFGATATGTSATASFYAHKGSGATDANKFALYNDTTASILSLVSIDYDTGVLTTLAGVAGASADAGNGWWRITLSATSGISAGNQLRVYACFTGNAETAGEYAYLYGTQGEFSATATEYQAVGGTYIYHGSFVDGVKCFPTDLSGNPIPSTTMLGYQAEGARTNLCLQSNTLTTAPWADNGTTSATQNVVGPDGATSAWTLTDNDAGIIEWKAQDITLTAAAHTFSVFVKKTTGAQSSYPLIIVKTATHIALATIDTSNGVATAWSAFTGLTILSGVSANCVSFNSSFWRVSLTYTATAAAYTHALLPSATTNATQSTGTWDAAATGSAVFYGAQVELGSFASSYIATTTVAVTRNADALTYSSAGNIDGTVGWCYAEVSPDAVSASNQVVIGTNGANRTPAYQIAPTGAFGAYDGTNAPTFAASAFTANTSAKVSSSWGSAGLQGAVGGVVSAVTSFDGNYDFTDISVGVNNSSTNAYFGTIRNVRIGQRQLSASELGAITS